MPRSWRSNGAEVDPRPRASHAATAQLTPQVYGLLAALGVKTLIDAPCGDFSWIEPIARQMRSYIGIDSRISCIAAAQSRAAGIASASFELLDPMQDRLPSGDMILCRDGLVQLTFAKAHGALVNFAASGAPWLLVTTFPDLPGNADGGVNGWRPLNLERAPFGFPPPRALIIERPGADPNPRLGRKALGLWRLADIA
jgi:hypothetical protein